MKNLFGLDSPIFRFLTKVCDMVILNLLWIGCCIPIVTIGASTTALYRCIEKMSVEGEFPIAQFFFSSFRKEFKQATALFGIVLIIISGLIVDVLFAFFAIWGNPLINRVLACILIFLIYPATCYIFPLQAHFDNKVFNTVKNAWLMSISHLPISLLVAAIHLLPLGLLYFFPAVFFRSIIIGLIIGGALVAWFSFRLLNLVFKKYENT